MHMSARIDSLLDQLVAGTLQNAEAKQLEQLLLTEDETIARQQLVDSFAKAKELKSIEVEKSAVILEAILQQGNPEQTSPIIHRIHFLKTTWFRYAAAVILIIGTIISYFIINRSIHSPNQSNHSDQWSAIPPATNRAILTIGNNRIDLSSNKTGITVNSTIAYNDGEKIADAGQMLQLTTPRGGQYQAVLPDGTKVWLNAASSIKFPSKFEGKKRREIEISGEVYLEIVKNTGQPFIVKANETEVQVLGTSFNINAYSDEEIIKTTLVEGSIKVLLHPSGIAQSSSGSSISELLKPNQQAQVNKGHIIVQTVNTNDVLAWKAGFFIFNEVSIEPIMRQLSRWYNIDVSYKGKVKTTFLSTIPRNVPLGQVLEALALTNAVKFEVTGNRVTVIGE